MVPSRLDGSESAEAELISLSHLGDDTDLETVTLSTRTSTPRFTRALIERTAFAKTAECALTKIDVVTMMHIWWKRSCPPRGSLNIGYSRSFSWRTHMWWGQLHSARKVNDESDFFPSLDLESEHTETDGSESENDSLNRQELEEMLSFYRQNLVKALLRLNKKFQGCSDTWLRLRVPLHVELRQVYFPTDNLAPKHAFRVSTSGTRSARLKHWHRFKSRKAFSRQREGFHERHVSGSRRDSLDLHRQHLSEERTYRTNGVLANTKDSFILAKARIQEFVWSQSTSSSPVTGHLAPDLDATPPIPKRSPARPSALVHIPGAGDNRQGSSNAIDTPCTERQP